MLKRLRDPKRAEEYLMMCDCKDDEMMREWLEGEIDEFLAIGSKEGGGKAREIYFV